METENNVCSICLHEFTQPKLLTCLHSYCYQCLLDYVNRSKQDGDQFPCPLCRHQIQLPSGGVQDFPDSPHGQINEVVDVVKRSETGDDVASFEADDIAKSTDDGSTNNSLKGNCDFCENNAVLKFRCNTCQQTLCDDCKTSHDKYFVKKNHEVVDATRKDENKSNQDQEKLSENQQPMGDLPGLEMCSVHSSRPVEVHCTQCLDSVCLLCFSEHHNGHKMLYLNNEETQTKLRQDLQKLNDDLQLQIDRLETFSQKLASERSRLQNSTEQDCNRVEEQVQLMCKMVKTRGDEIKALLRNRNAIERQKLETLMTEIDSSIKRLQSDINNASVSLEADSIVKILDVTLVNQKVETEFKFKDLVLPDLEMINFEHGKIDNNQLLKQLGSLEFSREQNFTLEFKIRSFTSENSIKKSFRFDGVTWKLGVHKSTSSGPKNLSFYLYLCESDFNSRDQRVEYFFTLINKTPSKSITWGPGAHRFTPGGNGYGRPNITPWSTLKDPSNGFTNKDGHFSVRIRIKKLSLSETL